MHLRHIFLAVVLIAAVTASPIIHSLDTTCALPAKLNNDHLQTASLLRNAIIKQYHHRHHAFFSPTAQKASLNKMRALLAGLQDDLNAYKQQQQQQDTVEYAAYEHLDAFAQRVRAYLDKRSPEVDFEKEKDAYIHDMNEYMTQQAKLHLPCPDTP